MARETTVQWWSKHILPADFLQQLGRDGEWFGLGASTTPSAGFPTREATGRVPRRFNLAVSEDDGEEEAGGEDGEEGFEPALNKT